MDDMALHAPWSPTEDGQVRQAVGGDHRAGVCRLAGQTCERTIKWDVNLQYIEC